MSGQSTCNAIAAIRENGKTNQQALDTLSNFSPGGVVKAYGAQNKSDNAVVNLIRQNLNIIQKTIVDNRCDNISSITQSNVYEDSGCWNSLLRLCRNDVTGAPDIACIKEVRTLLDRSGRAPITQQNKNSTMANCEINSAIQALARQEASLMNTALLESMQEAKGLLSGNQTSNLNCNEINTNITSDQYISVLLKCMNETSVNQSNRIDACNPNIIAQINDNNDMKKCLMNAGIISSTSQSSNVVSDSSLKNSQTAIGLDPAASLASLLPIIIIVVIVIIGVLVVPQLFNKKPTPGTK
jgi:hypothetical protein